METTLKSAWILMVYFRYTFWVIFNGQRFSSKYLCFFFNFFFFNYIMDFIGVHSQIPHCISFPVFWSLPARTAAFPSACGLWHLWRAQVRYFEEYPSVGLFCFLMITWRLWIWGKERYALSALCQRAWDVAASYNGDVDLDLLDKVLFVRVYTAKLLFSTCIQGEIL